jgi:hypothetical protein
MAIVSSQDVAFGEGPFAGNLFSACCVLSNIPSKISLTVQKKSQSDL